MNRNCDMENRVVHKVTNKMVRSVHVVARYTKIHIRYKILISRKLQYLTILWCQRCQITQILLSCVIGCWILDYISWKIRYVPIFAQDFLCHVSTLKMIYFKFQKSVCMLKWLPGKHLTLNLGTWIYLQSEQVG